MSGASKQPPRLSQELIGPAEAAQMLGTAKGNRGLNKRTVERYARDILAGHWPVNGQTIVFSWDGVLRDGQHRLQAVIQAGKKVPFLVVRGVDPESQITMDTGRSRSFRDYATIKGEPHAGTLGPIARWWALYEGGMVRSRIQISHQELEALLNAHPTIYRGAGVGAGAYLDSSTVAGSGSGGPGGKALGRALRGGGPGGFIRKFATPSVQGFVHAYTAEKYDAELADAFMQDLDTGASLAETSPIFKLRKRLIDAAARRLRPEHVLAITIKAWNAWINGEKMTSDLRWREGGPSPEPFPKFTVDQTTTPSKRKVARKK